MIHYFLLVYRVITVINNNETFFLPVIDDHRNQNIIIF